MSATTCSSRSSTPSTGLGADPQHLLRRHAGDVLDLERDVVGTRRGQIDLVDRADHREPLLARQEVVRERLRLDALGGVDHQHRALARREAARDLVGEVDVPGVSIRLS